MKLKNIPNVLSCIRLFLIFVFIYTFFAFETPIVALIVFLVAGATDVVDGFLARRFNWITDLGKILDPLADKLMQCTALACLWIKDLIPWWFAVSFFIKEGVILLLGLIVIKRRDVAVVSRWYGKLAVCLFYATIVISIIFREFLAANPLIATIIFVPAVICTIAAFVGYVKHYSYLKKEKPQRGYVLKNRKEQ